MMDIDKKIKKIISGGAFSSNALRKPSTTSVFGGGIYPHLNIPKFKPLKMDNIFKNFKLKKFGGKNDWDGDGIPNWKDCQPRNTMRQDWALEEARKEKVGKIRYMKPMEYLKRTGLHEGQIKRGFLDKYYDIETKQSEPISKLSQHIQDPTKKVGLPWLGHYGDHEGRHRMLAGQMAGQQTIPVIVPKSHKPMSKEIVDSFIEKRFPKSHDYYKRQWKERFYGDFPEHYMDKESRDAYEETLQEKGWKETDDEGITTVGEISNLKGYDDNDGDGIINAEDCEPNNPDEQGVFHKFDTRKWIDELSAQENIPKEDLFRETLTEEQKEERGYNRNIFTNLPDLPATSAGEVKKKRVI